MKNQLKSNLLPSHPLSNHHIHHQSNQGEERI
jgi:hypothetical protein